MNNFRRMPENINNQNCNTCNTNNTTIENNCLTDNLVETLCSQIGRRCTCEFSAQKGIETKSGMLERVGNDYIALRSLNNNRLMYCYTNNLLFVTINVNNF